MTKEEIERASGGEERISGTIPAIEELLSEAKTETETGEVVTTKVFRDRVEIITRGDEGVMQVEVMPTDVDFPE